MTVLEEQLRYIQKTMPEAYNYIQDLKKETEASKPLELPVFDDNDEIVGYKKVVA